MLIKLQDFKEGEIVPVRCTYNPKELDVESVDIHYTKPLDMEGTVEKGPDILTLRGNLHSSVEMMCGRCLGKTPSDLDKDFEIYYEIKGKDQIDATDDLRELLILEHPLAYFCNEKCKGLCPTCGINLNEATCKCAQASDSSLAKLKDIWDKRKKESN